ncbi:MAG: thermonuclease family protein, partial [Pyrinomonadaceae bacterium]
MKNLRPTLFILMILLLVTSGFAQRKFEGRVIEIVDGKTVVIEMGSGRLTAELQYIEIPEKEQPLYWTVRTHLEKLVLGKTVEFNPQGILPGKTFGQLLSGGLDIAQQMLRDGAAWHKSSDQSGQNPDDNTVYKQNQDQARDEKRGVWAIENLKPAWQFRAERRESEKQREQILLGRPEPSVFTEKPSQTVDAKPGAKKKPGMWGDTNPSLNNIGALLNGYNAKTKTGYLSTSLLDVTEVEKEKEKENDQQKTAVDITYFYKEDDKKGRKGTFVVSLVSISRDWRFLKFNDLVVVADERRTVIGKPKRTTFKDGEMVGEKLTYEVSRSSMEKFIGG